MPLLLVAKPSGNPQIIGEGVFESPETVVWDERRDVYLVSNVNGGLTAVDDNGFISRVAPTGEIIDARWIDGGRPQTTLNGPKGMLLTDRHLVVADVHTVRVFDRNSGNHVRDLRVPGSYMLNGLAEGSDGTLYCTDTGDEIGEFPGAVYRIEGGSVKTIARDLDLDRPDGLVMDGQDLLVAPFGTHAKTLYRLNQQGRRSAVIELPQPRLDGLLRLPDGRLVTTSWAGKAVYAVDGKNLDGKNVDGKDIHKLAHRIPRPAQIGYDRKRQRLLVPSVQEHRVLAYDVPLETSR